MAGLGVDLDRVAVVPWDLDAGQRDVRVGVVGRCAAGVCLAGGGELVLVLVVAVGVGVFGWGWRWVGGGHFGVGGGLRGGGLGVMVRR